MVEKGEIISDESKVANSFSKFFENGIRSLGIKTDEHSHETYALKELRNRTLSIILVQMSLCRPAFSTYSFGKLIFRLSVLSVFFVLNRMV